MSSTFSSKAGLNVPDGFVPSTVTDDQRFRGILFNAKRKDDDASISISTVKRNVINIDLPTYVSNIRKSKVGTFETIKSSEIEQTTINGLNAWRYETEVKSDNIFGTRVSMLNTILEGADEVVRVVVAIKSGDYDEKKAEFMQIANGIVGITAPRMNEKNQPTISNNQAPTEVGNSNSIESKHDVISNNTTASSLTVQTDTAPERLRQLNQLYKDGLIEKKEFDDKKKEILNSL